MIYSAHLFLANSILMMQEPTIQPVLVRDSPTRKLTWQWKFPAFKDVFPIEHVDFKCHVSFQGFSIRSFIGILIIKPPVAGILNIFERGRLATKTKTAALKVRFMSCLRWPKRVHYMNWAAVYGLAQQPASWSLVLEQKYLGMFFLGMEML